MGGKEVEKRKEPCPSYASVPRTTWPGFELPIYSESDSLSCSHDVPGGQSMMMLPLLALVVAFYWRKAMGILDSCAGECCTTTGRGRS